MVNQAVLLVASLCSVVALNQVIAIDRFSPAAASLFIRSSSNGFPAANQSIDFDAISAFNTKGLHPETGAPVWYYNFDVMPSAPAPIYVFINQATQTEVAGQLHVIDAIPGSPSYNDFWRVQHVMVPASYVANTITSLAGITSAAYTIVPTTTIVNCPVVPFGSTAVRRLYGQSASLTQGWYRTDIIFYFNFVEAPLQVVAVNGMVPTSPIYVSFRTNGDPGSGFMTDSSGIQTHNVPATLPTSPGYSPFWAVQIYDNKYFWNVTNLDTVLAVPSSAGPLVNCPIVTIEARVLSIDRFSPAAGTLHVRSSSNNLPAANKSIDFDSIPALVTKGLAPVSGSPVWYYNFDVMSTTPALIYVPVTNGTNLEPVGSLHIINVIPGDQGYNDFWLVVQVVVPPTYVVNSLTSANDVFASGYPLVSTTTIVNCPVVPFGSTASRRYPGSGSAGLIQGWYKNSIIYYFSFLEAPLALTAGRIPTVPIFVTFAQNGNPGSGFMTDASGIQTHNVPLLLPNNPGYSPLWNVYIYDNQYFSSVSNLATVPEATTPGPVVNCPIVFAPADAPPPPSASPSPAPSAAPSGPGTTTVQLSSTLSMTYWVNSSRLFRNVTSTGGNNWFSVGVSSYPSMVGGDVVVFLGLLTPPAQYVLTGHFAQGVNPVPAGQATIEDVTYGRTASGALFMAYSQPLANASYSGFVPIALGSSKNNVIAVQGSGGFAVSQHPLGGTVVKSISLYPTYVAPSGASPSSAPQPASGYTYSATLSSTLTLQWRTTAARVYMQVTSTGGNNWFACGVSSSAGMVGGDVVVFTGAASSPVQYVLTDRAFAGVNPVPVAQATVADVSTGTTPSGALYMAYSLPRAGAAYSGAVAIATGSSTNNLIFVQGSGGFSLARHSLSGAGVGVISFDTGTYSSTERVTALNKAHGALMFIAWTLFPVGILVARFTKHAQPTAGPHARWFVAHRAIQSTGALLLVIAFAIGVASVPLVVQFSSAHGVIGLVLMILAVLQVAWAVARPQKEAPGEAASRVRWTWVLCHRGMGYAMPLLAFANIFLGFQLLALPAGYYAAFAVWIFLFFLAFAVLSCMQGLLVRSPPLKADGGPAPNPMHADDPSVNGQAAKRGPEVLGSQVELIPVVV